MAGRQPSSIFRYCFYPAKFCTYVLRPPTIVTDRYYQQPKQVLRHVILLPQTHFIAKQHAHLTIIMRTIKKAQIVTFPFRPLYTIAKAPCPIMSCLVNSYSPTWITSIFTSFPLTTDIFRVYLFTVLYLWTTKDQYYNLGILDWELD